MIAGGGFDCDRHQRIHDLFEGIELGEPVDANRLYRP